MCGNIQRTHTHTHTHRPSMKIPTFCAIMWRCHGEGRLRHNSAIVRLRLRWDDQRDRLFSDTASNPTAHRAVETPSTTTASLRRALLSWKPEPTSVHFPYASILHWSGSSQLRPLCQKTYIQANLHPPQKKKNYFTETHWPKVNLKLKVPSYLNLNLWHH